jgi:hypothetical protein
VSYADNKRWRKRNPKKRYLQEIRYYQRSNQNPPSSRDRWTGSDMTIIIASNRPCDRVLARKLGRSMQAIQVKRCRVRKEKKTQQVKVAVS